MRNKYINERSKQDILKIYLRRILLYGAETWTTAKREDSKIHENNVFEGNFKQNKGGENYKN